MPTAPDILDALGSLSLGGPAALLVPPVADLCRVVIAMQAAIVTEADYQAENARLIGEVTELRAKIAALELNLTQFDLAARSSAMEIGAWAAKAQEAESDIDAVAGSFGVESTRGAILRTIERVREDIKRKDAEWAVVRDERDDAQTRVASADARAAELEAARDDFKARTEKAETTIATLTAQVARLETARDALMAEGNILRAEEARLLNDAERTRTLKAPGALPGVDAAALAEAMHNGVAAQDDCIMPWGEISAAQRAIIVDAMRRALASLAPPAVTAPPAVATVTDEEAREGVPAMDGGPPPSIMERHDAACRMPDGEVPAAMWREIRDGLRAEADRLDFTRSDTGAARLADRLRQRADGCDAILARLSPAAPDMSAADLADLESDLDDLARADPAVAAAAAKVAAVTRQIVSTPRPDAGREVDREALARDMCQAVFGKGNEPTEGWLRAADVAIARLKPGAVCAEPTWTDHGVYSSATMGSLLLFAYSPGGWNVAHGAKANTLGSAPHCADLATAKRAAVAFALGLNGATLREGPVRSAPDSDGTTHRCYADGTLALNGADVRGPVVDVEALTLARAWVDTNPGMRLHTRGKRVLAALDSLITGATPAKPTAPDPTLAALDADVIAAATEWATTDEGPIGAILDRVSTRQAYLAGEAVVDAKAKPAPGDATRERLRDAVVEAADKIDSAFGSTRVADVIYAVRADNAHLTGAARATCTDYCPAGFAGHWRDYHRGHGCDKDPDANPPPRATAPTPAVTGPRFVKMRTADVPIGTMYLDGYPNESDAAEDAETLSVGKWPGKIGLHEFTEEDRAEADEWPWTIVPATPPPSTAPGDADPPHGWLNEFHRINEERGRTAFAPAHSLMALVACVQEEVGELAAAVLGVTGEKKRKAHLTNADVLDAVADAMTYLSLVASTVGCMDLQGLLGSVFNMVSERAGSSLRVPVVTVKPAVKS